MNKAKKLWDEYQSDATWEPYDTIDAYDTECNITLEVYGFRYEGTGTISCGEKIVSELFCTTPDGVEIKLV
jgi:hypothetical protein